MLQCPKKNVVILSLNKHKINIKSQYFHSIDVTRSLNIYPAAKEMYSNLIFHSIGRNKPF